MSEKKFKCTFPGCDRDAAFVKYVCELLPRPFSMKESDVKRKPPFGELMREFIVKCPKHGERYAQEIGHHISTIPKKSEEEK